MRKIDDSGPRKIGLEKVNVTPFFGNEKQAFSLKKEAAVESAPKSYAIKQEEEQTRSKKKNHSQGF